MYTLKTRKNAHRSHLKQVQPATLNISFSETNTKQWPAYLKLTKHWKKKSPCLNAWRAFLWRQHKLPPRTSHSHIYKQLHLTHKSLEFLRNHQKRQHNQDTQEVPKKKKKSKMCWVWQALMHLLFTNGQSWMTKGCYFWTKCAEPDSIPPVLLQVTCALSILATGAVLVGQGVQGCCENFCFFFLLFRP